MITQDLLDAGNFATVAETAQMNECLAEGDLYGWANQLEKIAFRMKKHDSQYALPKIDFSFLSIRGDKA